MTGAYELAGAGWDPVEDTPELCHACGDELGVHDVGAGCLECGCMYGVDGWAVDDHGAWVEEFARQAVPDQEDW